MQVYVILQSGQYAMDINGKEEVADRTSVVGIYSSREVADATLRTFMDEKRGAWRGVTSSWVDTAVIDEAPIWE